MIEQNLRDSQIPVKKYYDIGTKEPNFDIGSKVQLHDPTTKPGNPPNLRKDALDRLLLHINHWAVYRTS